MNGRVNLEEVPDMNIKFLMTNRIPVDDKSDFRDALTGSFIDTPMSKAFFSEKNQQIIQNAVRYEVYNKSNENYLIGEQDYSVLKLIMRGIYLQNSINLTYDYTKQIIELNKLVIKYCVDQLLCEVEGYIKYTRDISTLVSPIPLPSYSSSNTSKSLELKPWL